MGGCTNSKYAKDEDKLPKKDKKPKDKKNKNKKQDDAVVASNGDVPKSPVKQVNESKVEKEEIDFIDKDESEKQQQAAAAAAAAANEGEDDDVKKETTTYQTTVVKHTQKEGDELMQHLKEEAFKTLQALLKQKSGTDQEQTVKSTTTASSSANTTPETTTTDSETKADDIVEQIKSQLVSSLGKNRQDFIGSIVDASIELIKDGKVNSMEELQSSLESKFSGADKNEATANSDFIKKVINGTTGFLTAKGTEAGALLSSILANVSSGLQGVMNETEKTTVKVTRTVTEQLMSGGEIKNITKVITRSEPTVTINPNINEILKNLSDGATNESTGKTSTTTTTLVSEKLETLPKDLVKEVVIIEEEPELDTKKQAEQVVNTAISAAVEKVLDDENKEQDAKLTTTNGHVDKNDDEDEDLKKVTIQNVTVTSETPADNSQIDKNDVNEIKENIKNLADELATTTDILNDDVQSEFYSQGKKAAEEVVNKINDLSEPTTA